MTRTTEAAQASGAIDRERVWQEAWARALPMVDGCERGRVAGARPGVELAYLDWGGEGPLVVLLHANGFGAATWAPIASALRRRCRLVAFDARGHGESTAVPPVPGSTNYAWTELAADFDRALEATLARTGRGRIELAVGHSMGGALVTLNALDRPERFARLLLCDPVLLPPVPRDPTSDAPRANPLAAATRKRRDRFPSAAEAYAHCRSRGLYADFTPEALALYVGLCMRETGNGEWVLRCDREVEAAIFDNGGSLDVGDRMGSLAAELVILHARRSGFSLPYYQTLAERAPKGRVESVDAGHLFVMDEPALVVDWIERMLA